MSANVLNSRKLKYDWTEILVGRLRQACILYPKESLFRMKRIANYVGGDVTYRQCYDKLNHMNEKKNFRLSHIQEENDIIVPTFPSHEKYPFDPDGIPIGCKYKFHSSSKWTKDMDDKLREAEKLFPPGSSGSIKNITKFVGGGITEKQIINRRTRFLAEKPPVATNAVKWTSEMDRKLLRAVEQCNGIKSTSGVHWHSVNEIMNMHNRQCFSRWHFIKHKIRNSGVAMMGVESRYGVVNVGADRFHWTSEMDQQLAQAVQQCSGTKYANSVHWPSVNKIMSMHNKQCKNRWHNIKNRVNKTSSVSRTGVVKVGTGRGDSASTSGRAVTEAEDYLSESDYWVDVSDPATAKRLNRRKRNRALFMSMWNSDDSGDNNTVVYVVHSSDSSYCNDIIDDGDSVCSDDLHSVSDVDCHDSAGTGSSHPVKRQRCDGDDIVLLDDKNSVDFENYVTITDELIDMLGLYDDSSGESDCE